MPPKTQTPQTRSAGFLSRQISFGVALFAFIGMLALASFLFYNFRQTIYSYTLTIPDGGTGKQTTFDYGPKATLANANYFASVRSQFVQNGVNFIEADLSVMRLRVYKNGTIALDVPILSKGRDGSWWETPAGIYKIESKEENHFSSFGQVNQPWSLAFQGNFFIHGWPTYPDGTPVSSAYSGGCIRLSDDDARKVYNLADLGMPVLVYEQNFGTDMFSYELHQPIVSAEKYLTADLKNNFVFIARGSTDVVPIASITKLVTALVSAEYINLDKKVVITKMMIATTSKPRLAEGQSVGAFQLLYPLLLESSNEAAEALARTLGRARFISLMNDKAVALGMSHTTLVDPSGVSGNNISTAEDLFNLAQYIYNNRSFIFKLTSGGLGVSAYGAPYFKNLQNFNEFAGNAEFVGGKVGESTSAGETMLSVFEIPIHDEIRPIAIIVLGSRDKRGDTETLLNFVKQNYQ